ncbi:uncharacterized protein LOC144878270 [Branchiostoma floridae x Branchiostoma japonicum]
MRSIPILLVLLVLVETGYPAILPTEGRLSKATLDDEAAMPPTEGRLSKTTLDDEAAMPPTEGRLSKTTPDDDKLRTLQTSLINKRMDEITENMTRLSKRMDDVVSKVKELEGKGKKRSNVEKLIGKKEKKDIPEGRERGRKIFSTLKRPKERLHHRKGTLYGKGGPPRGGRGWTMTRAKFSRNRKPGSRKAALIPDESGKRGLGYDGEAGNGKSNRSENMTAGVVSKGRKLEGNGKKRINVGKLMEKKEKKDSPERKERRRKAFYIFKRRNERLHNRQGALKGQERQTRVGSGWRARAVISGNRKLGSRKDVDFIPDKGDERGLGDDGEAGNGTGNRLDSPEGKERVRKAFSIFKRRNERLHNRQGALKGQERQTRVGSGWRARAVISENRKLGSRKDVDFIPDKSDERGLGDDGAIGNERGNLSRKRIKFAWLRNRSEGKTRGKGGFQPFRGKQAEGRGMDEAGGTRGV